MVDSSEGGDADQKNTAPLSDQMLITSRKSTCSEKTSCDVLWQAVSICQFSQCCSSSQSYDAVTARHKVRETEMKKVEIHTYLYLHAWRGKGLNVCMCVMSQCVTGTRLSPSLHPDSSVKQGLTWSVYVFENMCVCVSGLMVFLFFFLTLFTSDLQGVPGSCLMDSLAPLSWPLAQALSWSPN